MNFRNLTRGLAPEEGESVQPLPASEETLVPDVRSGLTLAELVERRLVSLLQITPLPADSRSKFKPTAVGQIAAGVTRFEVVASITGLLKRADRPTPAYRSVTVLSPKPSGPLNG